MSFFHIHCSICGCLRWREENLVKAQLIATNHEKNYGETHRVTVYAMTIVPRPDVANKSP